ncbi:phosphonoacetaldehyde hydrolase [Bowmanella sp. Y26]|uniref:phosphonoacetaldehyde hydrolase n=1 Tax=Bowmanella yangjiangensis TaxID=2811230 RepID=UPI001BDD7F97|nr:phosphonoacetaldehyde hydrolase [Bowmanella yangjiangensis]MBT1065075.1 phosphonoacetaldehyde hydrolase [Bowmanella yangjiangensis]
MQQLNAVILDWAGTVVDFGSVAPTSIFVEAFARAYQFDLSLAEARIPMGMGKWDHIHTLGQLSSVRERWVAQFGQPMTDAQVDEIYRTFMPLQKAKVAERAAPIPGVLAVLEQIRERGMKIGSCSGYPREVMEALLPVAADYGYQPDCVVCSDDLAAGSRPGPWMALQNVIELGLMAVSRCVKVDDSAPGIEEGLNAGMWTVGLSLTGNAVGLTLEEWQDLDAHRQQQLKAEAQQQLSQAHYVIDSLADILPVLDDIEQRLARGERP